MRISGAAIAALLALLSGAMLLLPSEGRAEDETPPDAEIVVAIMGVLDRYMDAVNALDLDAHVETYHFPHFRLASGRLAVWATPEEAMPLHGQPREKLREGLRASLGPEWHRSVWTKREIVQADATKVHVATRFARLREDGSEITTYDSLYVLTLEEGTWAIKGRSSFAP